MELISKIIEAEQKAQSSIAEARKKSDEINKNVLIEGNKIIEAAKKEAFSSIERLRQEYSEKFDAIKKESDQKLKKNVEKYDQYCANLSKKLFSELWLDFVNFLN